MKSLETYSFHCFLIFRLVLFCFTGLFTDFEFLVPFLFFADITIFERLQSIFLHFQIYFRCIQIFLYFRHFFGEVSTNFFRRVIYKFGAVIYPVSQSFSAVYAVLEGLFVILDAINEAIFVKFNIVLGYIKTVNNFLCFFCKFRIMFSTSLRSLFSIFCTFQANIGCFKPFWGRLDLVFKFEFRDVIKKCFGFYHIFMHLFYWGSGHVFRCFQVSGNICRRVLYCFSQFFGKFRV